MTVGRERQRLLKAQADTAEMRLKLERGKLCRIEEAIAINSAVVRGLRSHMLALPARVSGRLPHLSRADIETIREEVYAVLTMASDANNYPKVIVPPEAA